jgi:hypothetical protein
MFMCCSSSVFLVCLFTQFSLGTLPSMFTHYSCIYLCIVFITLSTSIYNSCVFMIFFPIHTRFSLIHFCIFLHNSWNIMQFACSCSFMTCFIVHTFFLQTMRMKIIFITIFFLFAMFGKQALHHYTSFHSRAKKNPFPLKCMRLFVVFLCFSLALFNHDYFINGCRKWCCDNMSFCVFCYFVTKLVTYIWFATFLKIST